MDRTLQENQILEELRELDLEQLLTLLCRDAASGPEEDTSYALLVMQVIEEKEQRNPESHLSDVNLSLADFQSRYNVPEGENLSLFPADISEQNKSEVCCPQVTRSRHRWRKAATLIAAVLVLMLSLMLVAQAAEIDIFGAVSRWAEETFLFVTGGRESDQTEGGGEFLYVTGDDS